jgi:predicted permease
VVSLFLHNLLPVLLTAGAGYVLAARTRIDVPSVSQVAFHLLAPCLVYRVIVDGELPAGDVARMIVFGIVALGAVGLIGFAVARMLRLGRRATAALVLAVLLPNAGNFGLSANLLAFGEPGLAQAGVFFVTSSVMTYTVGVLVASLGRSSPRDAFAGLVRVPAVWAVVAAVIALQTGWRLPYPARTAVGLLADACVPVFLVVLGLQLGRERLRAPGGLVWSAVGLRLAGGAAVALVLAPVLGLTGVARQAGVLQASMPSAVIGIILAIKYDVEPGFVTSVVLWSTLLSPLTLTPLLRILGA